MKLYKNLIKSKFLLLLFVFSAAASVWAQNKKVELLRANELIGTTSLDLRKVRKLLGDVQFRHEGAIMYCDSSYQFEETNDFEAFNHIKVIKGDSQQVTGGSHMLYEGDTKIAQITGDNLVLQDKSVFLYTTILDYDLGLDIANYYENGKVVDKNNVLTSRLATFYKKKNRIVFRENVIFTDQKYTIFTDTMEYDTKTKMVYFKGPSKITNVDGGVMYAIYGEYDSERKLTRFNGRSTTVYKDFKLISDKINYNQLLKKGEAKGNVELVSVKDSLTVFGDIAQYSGTNDAGVTKIFPRPLAQIINAKDTLFLSADTLYAVNDASKKQKQIVAVRKVKIFNKMMQGICDSLQYNMMDSTITFYKDPVIWHKNNQLKGDTIKIISKNKQVERMLLNNKSFIISLDTLNNYNQVKGKNMITLFRENKIHKIDVKENSETIYYALQGDTVTFGMNRANSKDIQVRFDQQKVKTIAFYTKPKATFIPLHELRDEDQRLKGFKWRIKERPLKKEVLGKYNSTLK